MGGLLVTTRRDNTGSFVFIFYFLGYALPVAINRTESFKYIYNNTWTYHGGKTKTAGGMSEVGFLFFYFFEDRAQMQKPVVGLP